MCRVVGYIFKKRRVKLKMFYYLLGIVLFRLRILEIKNVFWIKMKYIFKLMFYVKVFCI